MIHVDAIYHNGVFEPLEPVNLQNEQRVTLSFEAVGKDSAKEWLETVRQRKAEFVKRHGMLPDSTPDIAADRLRDI
jgi:predicted DNA-binding antitoxin AbrB/MazE fold protein